MAKTKRAIVIGSGAGGLAAAAYMAKEGLEVLVLERSARLGGLLAPFTRDGFTFEPGLHAVGQCRPEQMVHDILGDLGIDASELFCELDPDGFDDYRFPDFEVKMCRGIEAYRDRLRALFPEDRYGFLEVFAITGALREMAALTSALAHRKPRLSDLSPLLELPAIVRFGRSSLTELLHHFLSDPRSVASIAAPCSDYGLPPSRASAIGALAVMAHYADGAFFPRGGSGALRDALVERAMTRGAIFRTQAEVLAIVVKDGVAEGVRLAGGEMIPAHAVISDVDPTITLSRLVPEDSLPARLRKKVAHTMPSLGACSVFLGLRRDLRRYGMGAFNIRSFPLNDIEALYAPLLAGELPVRLPLFLSSGSLKDDSGALAPSGCSTLEITTLVPDQLFAPWEKIPAAERGDDYRACKQALEDRILDEVSERFPGLIADIDVCVTSTPLANLDRVGAAHGSAYGPAMTPDQWGPFRFGTRTPVDCLFLAGAGALGSGVGPSLLSGKLAALAATHAKGEHAFASLGTRVY